jgi:hypothetical protein
MPLHEQGTDFVTPSAVSEQLEPLSAWQKLSLLQPQGLPTRLGEQKPPDPQSASTRQLLPVAQVFGAGSALDDRQAQGALPVQSESVVQSSYEQ